MRAFEENVRELRLPPEALFAEILGRATAINGGRGGSAYLNTPSYRFFGENSVAGAGAPIAVGAALAGRFELAAASALADPLAGPATARDHLYA